MHPAAPLLLAFLAALALTPLVRRLAIRLGHVAHPRPDRWRSRPTALLGGAAIAIPTIAGTLALAPLGPIWPIVAAATLMFAVGFTDDLRPLKASTKLVAQAAVALLLLQRGFALHWTTHPALDALLTVFWVVGITNAFNLLDNIDGLCAGVAAIACVALLACLDPEAAAEATYLWLLAGATAGFLVFNSKPASIFLGDGGSFFLGSSLAVLTLRLGPGTGSGTAHELAAAVAMPMLVLLVPILDTTLVTVSRLWHGKSPAVGGCDHASHRLVAIGLSERAAVGVLWMLSALGGAAAFALRTFSAEWSWAFAALVLAATAIFAAYLAQVRIYEQAGRA